MDRKGPGKFRAGEAGCWFCSALGRLATRGEVRKLSTKNRNDFDRNGWPRPAMKSALSEIDAQLI
jgi:hypothetical protein